MRKGILLFWPSFIIAILATVVFFSIFDPAELTLHGRVRPRSVGKNCLLQEYEVGDFYRAFTIHESIDAQKIGAECKNGLLTVHLPKVEAVRPRQIAVKAQ